MRRVGMIALRHAFALLVAALFVFCARRACADTIQAPVGGKPIVLRDRIACGAPTGGWTLDGRSLRPPAADDAIGRAGQIKLASAVGGCAHAASVTLVATGRWPALDPASLVVYVDDARAELRGKRLKGVRLAWNEGARRRDDTCLEPRAEGQTEVCTFDVGRKLPASPAALRMTWYPPGASVAAGVETYDEGGRRATDTELELRPSKIVLASLVGPGASVDVSRGSARMPLLHGDAVTTVECSPAFCDVDDGALVVRGVTQTAAKLRVRARLLPRVVLTRGDVSDTTPVFEVPILRCPMTLESGAPLSGVDDARAVVKLEGQCVDDVRSLRFFVGSREADVVRVDSEKDAAHVVVKLGRIDGEVSIRALRGGADATLVGVVRTETRRVPPIAATLELDDGVPIEFVPTNRFAAARIPPPAEGLRVEVVPVPGVYEVKTEHGVQGVRAVGPPGGYVALRYAIRSTSLSGALSSANLGIVEAAVQRPMHPANVPVPLGGVVEVRCVDREGRQHAIEPGKAVQVPFAERDGCFVALHRDRLRPAYGVQKLTLDIDVTRPDGASRPEAHVSEPTWLRAGKGARVAWVKGVGEPFDRVTVRVAHAQDEQHYASKTEQPLTPPASQWSLVMSTAHAHLFLTAAIPTVLYRVAEKRYSGVATLNFGVLSRFTWVDSEGHDGILALEAGVLGIGLSPVDTSTDGASLRQVTTILGLGLGTPVANRTRLAQTSIGIHAWFEYEVSRALAGDQGSPFGFLFGPSITFGNAGTYL